jgi:hypothetical protein
MFIKAISRNEYTIIGVKCQVLSVKCQVLSVKCQTAPDT